MVHHQGSLFQRGTEIIPFPADYPATFIQARKQVYEELIQTLQHLVRMRDQRRSEKQRAILWIPFSDKQGAT